MSWLGAPYGAATRSAIHREGRGGQRAASIAGRKERRLKDRETQVISNAPTVVLKIEKQ